MNINNEYINYIIEKFKPKEENKKLIIKIKDMYINIHIENFKWEAIGYKNACRKTSLDLSKEENWSILILFLKLLSKGYEFNNIYLEHSFKFGHKVGYVDVAIYDGKKPFAFIEVKKHSEYEKYTDVSKNKSMQLLSYAQQDKNVDICSYYSFDPETKKDCFSSILITENLKSSNSIEDFYEKWNKVWEEANILELEKFSIKCSPIKYENLKELNDSTIKLIFNQFLTILRQYSVSDKSNAFDKLINIFLVKVIDERNKENDYQSNGREIKKALKFQFIEKVDDNISFIKRLNDLYKDGMKEFMDKTIIDYKDEEIRKFLISNDEKIIKNDEKIIKIFDDLRLKKNNAFAFIEVFDDKTFEENSQILKEIVRLFQKYKFKYSSKYQFLGDFFEGLLNTSWKQEAGQFFTPMPIVDFMVKSLPIMELIEKNIANKKIDFLPKMIDFACGSGHFLISFMDEIQNCIINLKTENLNIQEIINKINSYKTNPYMWAKDTVIGIEKDYRLAKTTKISSFLNGDGEANIINGDGINKFSCEEFRGTILSSTNTKIEKFDYVITNPPFSVDGFLKNIIKNNISSQDFTLLKSLTKTSSKI